MITKQTNKKLVYIFSGMYNRYSLLEGTVLGIKESHNLICILLAPSNSPFEFFLKKNHIPVFRVHYRGKRDVLFAFFHVLFLLIRLKPTTVHTHFFDAKFIGLIAASLVNIKKRVDTRHSSTFHQVFCPKGVKYDRLANRLSTHIISISQATDAALLKERAPLRKIRKVYHGFDMNAFHVIGLERLDLLRKKWKIPKKGPVIGVIGRHIELKGIQYIIPAFRSFLATEPEACLVLVNAIGDYHNTLLTLLEEIPSSNVVMISFEEDIAALYHVFDIYIHTPVDATCEAFGQVYVESLACSLPCIFTLSGIAQEFIKNEVHALVVDFKNEKEITQALIRLWGDVDLRKRLGMAGRQAVLRFTLSGMVDELRQVYNE